MTKIQQNTQGFTRPDPLIETEWLAQNMHRPGLRIFDCGVVSKPHPDPELRKKYPVKPQSGRGTYEAAHIPGAGFIDVVEDLSDKTTELPLMMPPLDQVVERMSHAGIGNGTQVVLYSSTNPMWATRVWWMLRAVGFDNAVILNGGLAKWVAEKRPVAQGIDAYEPAEFKPAFRPELFVDKKTVLAALGEDSTLLMHALSKAVFEGRNENYIFGRKGRIPGSINLPAENLHDPASGTYHPAHVLRAMFEDVGAGDKDQIISYCGGGVNATNNAFVMYLLGYDNVTVYDGSMSEWGNDTSLPIE